MPKCDKITFVVGRNVTHNLLLYKKIGFLLKIRFCDCFSYDSKCEKITFCY